MGSDEAVDREPYKGKPRKERLEDNKVPGANPKSKWQTQVVIKLKEENNWQKQRPRKGTRQKERDDQRAIGADFNNEEEDQRFVNSEVKQQYHHEPKTKPTHGIKRQTKKRCRYLTK